MSAKVKCSDMSFPVYDGTEPTYKYFDRLAEYTSNIKRERYTIILNFINDWTKKKYAKLLDVKNIKHDSLPSENRNAKFLSERAQDIKDKFKLKHTFDDKSVKSEDVIKFLKDALNTIEYNIASRVIDGETYYNISFKSRIDKDI
jgi:hypothetical protein